MRPEVFLPLLVWWALAVTDLAAGSCFLFQGFLSQAKLERSSSGEGCIPQTCVVLALWGHCWAVSTSTACCSSAASQSSPHSPHVFIDWMLSKIWGLSCFPHMTGQPEDTSLYGSWFVWFPYVLVLKSCFGYSLSEEIREICGCENNPGKDKSLCRVRDLF